MFETKNEYREFREIQDEGIDLSKAVFDDKPITSGLFHDNISIIGTNISKGGDNLEPKNLCPECGNTYRTKTLLAIHRRKQHQGFFIIVISVNISLVAQVISANTRNLCMKAFGFLVICVSTRPPAEVILQNTKNLSMKAFTISVLSVINKQKYNSI